MIIGIGVDIIEIDRIKSAVERNGRFLEKYFSKKEREYFSKRKNRYEVIAGNFAAKEAFSKAAGTGIRHFALQDVEILRDSLGKPYIELHRQALEMLQKIGTKSLHVSISHCKAYAVANVVLER